MLAAQEVDLHMYQSTLQGWELVIHKFKITHRTMMLTNDVQQLLFE